MNVKKINQKINEMEKYPYPEIKNVYPNEKYATMLYDDFAGEMGELSAITQYVYEHINWGEKDDLR